MLNSAIKAHTWLFQQVDIKAKATLYKRGFIPGDQVNIDLNCQTDSHGVISKARVSYGAALIKSVIN